MARKVVYCIPSLHIHGGMERVVTLKANYLADFAGYEVYIVMTDAKGKAPFFPLSSRVHLIQLDEDFEELWNQPLWRRIFLYLKHQRGYRRKLTQCLMELRPDITISTLRREINFLCDIPDGSKKIGEIHMNRKYFRTLSEGGRLRCVYRWLQKLWERQLVHSLCKLDAFVALTDRDAEQWGELRNVHVIPNPLAFYIEKPERVENCTAMAMGRFCNQKGFDLLVQAWRKVVLRHPDWKLHFYGDDGEEFRRYIAQYHMEAYCIPHPFTDNTQAAMEQHSFFVLGSRFEGFGMVMAEAMACGLPVVAFDCPYGPREIIRDGEDGMLAKPENTDDLAEKLCRMIEDASRRGQMGERAHENIRRLHMEKVGRMWTDLFDELILSKS
jgi:glycosyltransferase involved in cell wall biosynthesis